MQRRPFDLFFIIVAVSVLFSVFANDIKGRIDFIMSGVMPAAYPQPYWPPIRILIQRSGANPTDLQAGSQTAI